MLMKCSTFITLERYRFFSTPVCTGSRVRRAWYISIQLYSAYGNNNQNPNIKFDVPLTVSRYTRTRDIIIGYIIEFDLSNLAYS